MRQTAGPQPFNGLFATAPARRFLQRCETCQPLTQQNLALLAQRLQAHFRRMPVRFPTRLAVHGLFGLSAQACFFLPRRLEFRLQFGKHVSAPLASASLRLEFGAQFLKSFRQLCQFRLALAAQGLLRTDGILQARDFRLKLVICAVGFVKGRLCLRLLLARGEHARLQAPVLRLDACKLCFARA